MGEIHELFVLALSLVWFAGATPDISGRRIGNIAVGRGFVNSSFFFRIQVLFVKSCYPWLVAIGSTHGSRSKAKRREST